MQNVFQIKTPIIKISVLLISAFLKKHTHQKPKPRHPSFKVPLLKILHVAMTPQQGC